MPVRTIKTKVIKQIGSWEIEKSYEQLLNCFDEPLSKPTPFYSCVFDDTIIDTFRTLKEAVSYCKKNQ